MNAPFIKNVCIDSGYKLPEVIETKQNRPGQNR